MVTCWLLAGHSIIVPWSLHNCSSVLWLRYVDAKTLINQRKVSWRFRLERYHYGDQHPTNIVLLTCDASGVLQPVSKLSNAQVMYHFISGYTSKMAGTEEGVAEPQATFSACFGQPFLILHPMKYAQQLSDKITQHNSNAWLLNTGCVGASAADGGKRCLLKYTRAILNAIHDGSLSKTEYDTYPTFNLSVPRNCEGVPSDILNPSKARASDASLDGLRNPKFYCLLVEHWHITVLEP